MKTGGRMIEMMKGEIQRDPAIHLKGCTKNIFNAGEHWGEINLLCGL